MGKGNAASFISAQSFNGTRRFLWDRMREYAGIIGKEVKNNKLPSHSKWRAAMEEVASLLQSFQSTLGLLVFILPVDQAFLVFFQDRGGHFLNKRRVGELGLNLLDFGFNFCEFLG
jgi:hypothetical protein